MREHDCGSEKFIVISKEETEITGENFYDLVLGRFLAEDVVDAHGNTVLKKGELITKNNISLIKDDNIQEVEVRSSLTCKCVSGVCQKCYGMDLSTRTMVQIGVPVGIIAAQSIGEPATQLTMNTFHTG